MNYLFIHQNFPGQFCHVASELAEQGHTVIGLGINSADPNKPLHEKVKHIRYKLMRSSGKDTHPLARETEAKAIRGESCAAACRELKKQGFKPDVIYGHPGWGELLFIKTIWPDVPLISFQEYFYNEHGYDANFDPEFAVERDWFQQSMLIMKNAYLYLTLEQADWNVSPTHFQAGTYPEKWKNKFSVIHDGVNVKVAKPSKQMISIKLNDGCTINSDNQVITFMNRRMEPYRGFHTFVRSIPKIQRKFPNAHIVIMGGLTGTSYGAPCEKGEWKDHFLKEIKGQYDPALVHFTGTIPYKNYIHLLQISKCHVYLTYPFVLSWSMLEAMACECPLVASDTAPVREVVTHGKDGLLFDFFSPEQLAETVGIMLKNPANGKKLGKAARQNILKNYNLDDCIQKQLTLIQMVQDNNLIM